MEKVIWSEGLFLRPQHLQQQDRYVDFQIRRRQQLTNPFGWGIHSLELDENLLHLGKIALVRAEGVMPDGTLFSVPSDPAKPLIFAQAVEEGATVCLAIPALVRGGKESHEDPREEHGARYLTVVRELADCHGTREQKSPVTTGVLRARLVVDTQLTEQDVALPLCRIAECMPDGGLRLDTSFSPPLLTLTAAPRLLGQGREVLSLVQTRARSLAARLTGTETGTISSVADLLLLQTLNRHVSVLGLLLSQEHLHPYDLFRCLTELSGELSALCTDTRLSDRLVPYEHASPANGFLPLYELLRSMLTRVFEQAAVSLQVHRRKFGLAVVPLPDMHSLRTMDFVLALKADMPSEQLVKLVPTRMKVGSIGRIRDIVNLQLPGCRLTHLAAVPRQLPYHAGYCYFRLEPQKDIWNDVEKSGGFAIHVSGEVAGLEMEAWSVKR